MLPTKLEGRLSPAAFAFFIQAINVHLRDAHSMSGVITDNFIAVATLWTSACWRASRFEKVCTIPSGIRVRHNLLTCRNCGVPRTSFFKRTSRPSTPRA